MAKNVNYFLKKKCEEYELNEVIRTEDLYENIANEYQKKLFAILHQEFNRLFKFMYSKGNGHFNAEESRELIAYIQLYEDMQYVLKNTELAFSINEEYRKFIMECKKFLVASGGSEIPRDLERITILEYEPIFFTSRMVSVKRKNDDENSYQMKLIGEGSYAQVFKFKDEFYDKFFIVKRAKKDLNDKELERFKKEYTIMKELKSPYILEVYKYDDSKREYYAEYADQTVYEYISKNNNTINWDIRKSIVYQIFKGFEYIHGKGYLHRDISLTNILLMLYEDAIIVKISDFGLVKEKDSNLTSLESEVKGSLNDSYLSIIGFKNYSIEYETYALTRLILFIMTGKRNIEKIEDIRIKEFVMKGTDRNINNRYKSIKEMKEYFNKCF